MLRTKPFGEYPVIGNVLVRSDARFEYYNPQMVARLVGRVGIGGIAERLTDQVKLRKMHRYLGALAMRKPNAFFVQVGAYDGRTNDHLYQHIQGNPGWSGLVVEPISDSYKKLAETYADRPNIRPIHAAIHETSGPRNMYRIPDEPGNDPRLQMLASFNKPLIASKVWMALTPDVEAVQESVECITLPELLEQENVSQIDILQVDAEGLDGLILDQLDLERYRPEAILFEHDNMAKSERAAHVARLTAAGYNFIPMSIDTFCYL